MEEQPKLRDIPLPFARGELLNYIIPAWICMMLFIPFFPLVYQISQAYIGRCFVLSAGSSVAQSVIAQSSPPREIDEYFNDFNAGYSSVRDLILKFNTLNPTTQVVVSMFALIFVLVVAYCLGHILSSLSIFAVEKSILSKMEFYPYYLLFYSTRSCTPNDIECGICEGVPYACDDELVEGKKCQILNAKKQAYSVKLPRWYRRYIEFLKCPCHVMCFTKGERKRMKYTTVYAAISCMIGSIVLTALACYSEARWSLMLFMAIILLKMAVSWIMRKAKQAVSRKEQKRSNIDKCFLFAGKTPFFVAYLILCLIAIPAEFCFYLLDVIFSLEKQFDASFRDKVEEKFKKTFGIEYLESESNAFWFMLISLLEYHPDSIVTKQTLYLQQRVRFARNLAGTFLLTAIAGMLSMMLYFWMLARQQHIYPVGILNILLLFYLFLFLGCYIRYKYLMNNRYTKLIIRSFLLLNIPPMQHLSEQPEHGS